MNGTTPRPRRPAVNGAHWRAVVYSLACIAAVAAHHSARAQSRALRAVPASARQARDSVSASRPRSAAPAADGPHRTAASPRAATPPPAHLTRTAIGDRPAPGLGYWLVAGALWSLGPGFSAIALDKRSLAQTKAAAGVGPEGTAALDERRDDLFSMAMGMSAFANAATIGVTLVGLPENDAVPGWAWASGALGVAVAGAGSAVMLAVEPCQTGQAASDCAHWIRDAALGPLLIANALAPLSMPLMYLVANAIGVSHPPVHARLTTTAEASVLHVEGRF